MSKSRAVMSPEDQFDLILLVALFTIALLSLLGMFPTLTGILPKIYSGIFRVVDMVKDKILPLKYI